MDLVKNYGHRVLELGMLYKSLLDMCKLPDRDRGLMLLKLAMLHFKAHKNKSKYAYEIMRLLVHQFVLLSEKKANEEFYGLFVNTHGHIYSHIPVDLQMEYIVKIIKKNLKQMCSNQTEQNVTRKTGALAGLHAIGLNYDNETDVNVHTQKHSTVSSLGDELSMIEDLRKIKPFHQIPSRYHVAYPDMGKSVFENLDVSFFHSWIIKQCHKWATEIGN